jgi:hypothetical protein
MHATALEAADADIWMRYLRAGFRRNMLDISALRKLTSIVSPSSAEMLAGLFAENLRTVSCRQDTEAEAVLMLHAINTVVYNLRVWTKDSSFDADFLGHLLSACRDVMSELLSLEWAEWDLYLGLTLLEWQLNYKIGDYLTPVLTDLVSRSSLKHVSLAELHLRFVQEIDSVMLGQLLQSQKAEQMIGHLLRVWEHSFYNPEPLREPYTHVLCHFANAEGWRLLTKFTQEYVQTLTTSAELFSSPDVPWSYLPLAFVRTHFSTFLESAAGATVREVLLMTQTRDYSDVLQSPEYCEAVEVLVSSLCSTFETLRSTAPFLAKFVCGVCDQIKEVQPHYWKEISTLIVTKTLAPAICNPLVSGITAAAETAGIKLLSKTARILQHACLGKSVKLTGFEWASQHVQRWRTQLEQAFEKTYKARKSEPRNMALPKTLLVYDLTCLAKSAKPTDILKGREKPVWKVTSPTSGMRMSWSEAAQLSSQQLPIQSSSTAHGLMSADVLQRYYSSMQSTSRSTMPVCDVPVADCAEEAERYLAKPVFGLTGELTPDFRDFARRKNTSTFGPLALNETEYTEPSAAQLASEQVSSKAFHNPPNKPPLSLVEGEADSHSHFLRLTADERAGPLDCKSIERLDEGTSTDLDLDAMQMQLKNSVEELEMLRDYQKNEQLRIQKIHDYWATQYHDLRLENSELKRRNQELRSQHEGESRSYLEYDKRHNEATDKAFGYSLNYGLQRSPWSADKGGRTELIDEDYAGRFKSSLMLETSRRLG